MQAILCDTETTGTREPIQVIEFAWREVTNDLRVTDKAYCRLFSHTQPIEWGALATHNILPQELAGLSPFTEEHIPPASYFIGHNIDYDWKAVGQPEVRRICTLALARALWPDMDSHKLGALLYKVCGVNEDTRDRLRQSYSAAGDVGNLALILPVLANAFGATTLDGLWRASEDARIPKIMTFGKYKDQPIGDVDRGWYNWYRRQSDTDPYLLEAFKRAGF